MANFLSGALSHSIKQSKLTMRREKNANQAILFDIERYIESRISKFKLIF